MYLLSKAVRIRSRWENALTKNREDSFVHESLVHKHLPVNVYFGFHQSHKRSSHNSNSSGEITCKGCLERVPQVPGTQITSNLI